jgi:hypothetical protein
MCWSRWEGGAFRCVVPECGGANTYPPLEKAALRERFCTAAPDVAGALRCEPRFHQSFLDALVERRFRVVDGLQKHVEDYAAYGCPPEEYVQRFYIGHYNPRGNHFFAFAIKDELVAWLDPRPPAYDRHGEAPLRALAATLA